MPYKPTDEDKANPCVKCKKVYDGVNDMICCDNCDVWAHVRCAGLLKIPPDNTNYYCATCIALSDAKKPKSHKVKTPSKETKDSKDTGTSSTQQFESRIAGLDQIIANQRQKLDEDGKAHRIEIASKDALIAAKQAELDAKDALLLAN